MRTADVYFIVVHLVLLFVNQIWRRFLVKSFQSKPIIYISVIDSVKIDAVRSGSIAMTLASIANIIKYSEIELPMYFILPFSWFSQWTIYSGAILVSVAIFLTFLNNYFNRIVLDEVPEELLLNSIRFGVFFASTCICATLYLSGGKATYIATPST